MLTFTMKLVITGSEHQKRLVIEIKLQILDLCQSTGPIVLYSTAGILPYCIHGIKG